MSLRASIFVFALFVAHTLASYKFVKFENQLEKAEYPDNFTTLETLKEFVRLVEKHNLNVSIIISQAKNYEDGNMKEAMAMTFTLPVNQESIAKTTLNKEAFTKFAKIANEEKLTAAGTAAHNNKLTVITNNRAGLPMTKEYKIFTGIKNGRTGFVFDEENYAAQYTFLVTGEDGKNHTTRVFHGDIDIEVVCKSDSMKDEDLTAIKKAAADALFTFEEEDMPRGTIAYLSKLLPEKNFDVAVGVGEDSFVDSDYYAMLKILDENVLVYAS